MVWLAYAIGATVGGVSHIVNAANAYKYYDDLVDQLKEQKKLALEDLTLDFENSKNTAFKNANRQDTQSTMNESLTSADVNYSLENLQLGQIMEGLQNTQARESISQNKGNELSNIAASGIRAGGSLSDAVELETSQNTMQYDFQKEASRKQQDYQLGNILRNLNSNVAGIQADRTDAYDLRESFTEGTGYQWKKFNNAYKQTEINYDKALKEARNARDDNSPTSLNYWINNITSAASMGATVGSTVNNISEMINNVKSPVLNTNTSGNTSMSYINFGKDLFTGFDTPQFKVTFSNVGRL